ncbi:MAG: hypothetical protein IH987_04715 [Planctomycetes bacterium]|nr:hypothetical protein [Planctomycetota bacterium]
MLPLCHILLIGWFTRPGDINTVKRFDGLVYIRRNRFVRETSLSIHVVFGLASLCTCTNRVYDSSRGILFDSTHATRKSAADRENAGEETANAMRVSESTVDRK